MELITPGLGLIFWMTISFSVVLLVLRKYAWRPILANIRARERTIAKSLINARRMDEEMLKFEKLKMQRMAELEQETQEMMKQAMENAGNIIDQARKKATEEAGKILNEAHLVIEAQKKAAMLDIKNQIAQLSIDMAEKVLQEEFSDKEKSNRYVNRLLDKTILN